MAIRVDDEWLSPWCYSNDRRGLRDGGCDGFHLCPFLWLGGRQLKLLASSVLPLPSYTATFGYGHSGRVRRTPCAGWSFTYLTAMISCGATSSSTQRSSALRMSCSGALLSGGDCARFWPKAFGPGPPPQWSMPGTM